MSVVLLVFIFCSKQINTNVNAMSFFCVCDSGSVLFKIQA